MRSPSQFQALTDHRLGYTVEATLWARKGKHTILPA
jgi:hypothetical protein